MVQLEGWQTRLPLSVSPTWVLTAGVDALTVAILAGRGDPSMLASRTLAAWLGKLVANGYRFHLIFLWLPTPDFAVDRVADRVRLGGHSVPAATVRRRYRSGLGNFFRLYRPIAATWRMYNNSQPTGMTLIAVGKRADITQTP